MIDQSTTRMPSRRPDAPAVYTFDMLPGVPPVGVARLSREVLSTGLSDSHAHTHDFLVLAYFERGGGSMWLGQRGWPVEDGDVYVVAPGEVVGVHGDARRLADAEGWAAYFAPDVLAPRTPGTVLAWRTHPLLVPFVRGAAGGPQRLKVPPADRPAWSERFQALELELQRRQDGYREAVVAHLTLLLVGVARLAGDPEGEPRFTEEPLIAAVFRFIDERFGERVSLREVARAVCVSPGHLTTVIRRKTGRTVQEWIAERRMAEARRLLVETDLAVEEIGRRVGYRDPGYFMRSFRRVHGTTPLGWRRAGRP
jgi:AraC-like DNA-binding protein